LMAALLGTAGAFALRRSAGRSNRDATTGI
jgi:hypothetical protein